MIIFFDTEAEASVVQIGCHHGFDSIYFQLYVPSNTAIQDPCRSSCSGWCAVVVVPEP